MIIYKDILTDHELLSDVYPIKDIGDGLWEVDLANVVVGNEDIVLEGANESAEGEDAGEGVDDSKQTVLNIVRDFRVQPMAIEKKPYMAEIKSYMKAVEKKLKDDGASEETINEFKKGAQTGVKRIIADFKNFEFYINEDYASPSMLIALNYREDGTTPYILVFKHGFGEIKV